MFRPYLIYAPLFAFCCRTLTAAEIGPPTEFAMADFRLTYDSLTTLAALPEEFIAHKLDSVQDEAFAPKPGDFEPAGPTNSVPQEIKVAARIESGSVKLRPVATGKAPSMGLYRKRLPSRYRSGAWLDVQSGYGDVLVEDRVGRARANGAGIQDPDYLYLRVRFRF